jgi:hypothetical protein
MREDGFRAFLKACNYTPNAVASRLSRCRTIERRLRADLDTLDLSAGAIPVLRARLAEGATGPHVLSNLLNAARTYARFRSGEAPIASPIIATTPQVEAQTRPFADASVPELMRFYAAILSELKERGIARTGNGPVGDYAEALFARAYGWRLGANSEAACDAVDDAGIRYQIKGRRLTTPSSSRQLGALRCLPERGFDILAAILFDVDVTVLRAVPVPIELVEQAARRAEHTNSWRLMLSDKLCAAPGVIDVTDAIRRAAST